MTLSILCRKKTNLIFLALLLIFFSSCRTFHERKNVPEALNYSNEEVVKIEIERINSYMESEPVRALWRSSLLGREDVLKRAKKTVEENFERSFDQGDFLTAKKYYKALLAVDPDWASSKISYKEFEKKVNEDIPGLTSVNDKAPSKISDCMNATVTIWVDRGIKVQNGSGFADIIIGSGFFIDKRGYLITNYHVIESMVDPKYEGYSRLYIKLLEDSNTKIPAKVIGYDSVLDLALLKVEMTPKYVFNLGSSNELELGDKVSAIGTPIGLEGTITSGIISSVDRKLLSLGNVFQIDAAVNSGNSGGPLIDEKLKVQAIVFAGMLQFQGLNFAIPIEYLRQELPLLYSHGEIVHPWISAFGDTKKNGNKKEGLEIQYILPGGSAFMSGMKAGDVIVSLDGKRIESLEDFNFQMMSYETESLLTCSYRTAQGDDKTCLLYLDKRPEHPGFTVYETDLLSNAMLCLLGMRLLPSSTENRNSYTIDRVISGSTADDLHFSSGDEVKIINVAVDQKNEFIYIQLYTKRKKTAFIDIAMGLSASFDSPYYF